MRIGLEYESIEKKPQSWKDKIVKVLSDKKLMSIVRPMSRVLSEKNEVEELEKISKPTNQDVLRRINKEIKEFGIKDTDTSSYIASHVGSIMQELQTEYEKYEKLQKHIEDAKELILASISPEEKMQIFGSWKRTEIDDKAPGEILDTIYEHHINLKKPQAFELNKKLINATIKPHQSIEEFGRYIAIKFERYWRICTRR
jgi:hypothetical protein